MGKFKGKKLLMLGTTVSTCEIINYAHKEGATVIYTDNLKESKGRSLSDKHFSLSTADIQGLYEIGKSEKIDGVISGAHEFNIEQGIILSEKLSLNSFCTLEQWKVTSNKRSFKDLCISNNVPVVEEYLINDLNDNQIDEIEFPIIIKPVDSSFSQGIVVCYNRSDFEEKFNYSMSFSKKKEVIVERYMTGDEIVVYYTAQDGYISLSAICDRYTNREQKGLSPLPTAYVFPSKIIKEYVEFENNFVIKMFESIGFKNGFIFLQGFRDGDSVRFYEMGLRIAGAQGHKIIHSVNGINPLEMLVDYTITGTTDDWDISRDDNPFFEKMACKLTPILKQGKISRIVGLEEILNMNEVYDVVPVNEIGSNIEDIGTLKQLLTRIFIVADNKSHLEEVINTIQTKLKVYDEQGRNMLLSGFDPKNLYI